MKIVSSVLVLMTLLGTSLIVEAKVSASTMVVVAKPNVAISRAVQKYTDANSQDVGKVKINSSDVQGEWALVWAESTRRKLDPAQYLLHKEKGNWKVLVMGTSLVGTGKEYKVPSNLQKKWKL